MEKTKEIKRTDILEAAMNATQKEPLKKMFSEIPILILLLPVIAEGIADAIFEDETEVN